MAETTACRLLRLEVKMSRLCEDKRRCCIPAFALRPLREGRGETIFLLLGLINNTQTRVYGEREREQRRWFGNDFQTLSEQSKDIIAANSLLNVCQCWCQTGKVPVCES